MLALKRIHDGLAGKVSTEGVEAIVRVQLIWLDSICGSLDVFALLRKLELLLEAVALLDIINELYKALNHRSNSLISLLLDMF